MNRGRSLSSIRGLAFDLEGTIVDLESARHQAHLKAAAALGVTLSLDEALTQIVAFIGGPDERIAEEVSKLADRSLSRVAESFLRLDRQFYQELAREAQVKARPGFRKFAMESVRRGLKIAIGSLTNGPTARDLIGRAGLNDLFDDSRVVVREDVAAVKPSTEVFLETAERMGIHPVEQAVFDDSEQGIVAGVTAGSVSIAMPVYRRPEIVSKLFRAGAARVYFDWREVRLAGLLESIAEDKDISFPRALKR